MFQEDGKLRYIEGVDNGDAPAHDGTYEAALVGFASKGWL